MRKQDELELEFELNEEYFTATVVCSWEEDRDEDEDTGYRGELRFIGLDWIDDIYGDVLISIKKFDELKKYVQENIEFLFDKKMRG